MLKVYESITKVFKMWVGHKLFSVTFIKKNGEKRNLVGTFSPQMWKGIPTTNGKGLSWNPTERGYLVIFDFKNEGWRMVNINTIKKIKFENGTFEFNSLFKVIEFFLMLGMKLQVDGMKEELTSDVPMWEKN